MSLCENQVSISVDGLGDDDTFHTNAISNQPEKKKQKIFQESSQHSGYDQFWHVSLFVALFGIVLEIIRVTCTSMHEFSYTEEFFIFHRFLFQNSQSMQSGTKFSGNIIFLISLFWFRDDFIPKTHIYKSKNNSVPRAESSPADTCRQPENVYHPHKDFQSLIC